MDSTAKFANWMLLKLYALVKLPFPAGCIPFAYLCPIVGRRDRLYPEKSQFDYSVKVENVACLSHTRYSGRRPVKKITIASESVLGVIAREIDRRAAPRRVARDEIAFHLF